MQRAIIVGLWLVLVNGSSAAPPPSEKLEGTVYAADEQTLVAAGLATDGPALLTFLRQRSSPGGDVDKIKALIQQLADPEFEKREKASAALLQQGPHAVPWLRQVLKNSDVEVVRRAQACLKQLDKDPGDALVVAAVRLLAVRRPTGAVEALLAHLPLVADDGLAEEVRASLAVVGFRGEVPDQALMSALEDRSSAVRAAGAEVLAKRGGTRFLPEIKRLLRDADPGVRLRAAQLVADARDPDAVPVLIALITALPAAQAGKADAVLRDLAGARAPATTPGGDNATPQKCHDAWNAWWAALDDRSLLDPFRNSTLSDADRDAILALIRQLGDDNFDVREQATQELVRRGAPAVPLLQRAARDPDIEVVRRCEGCLAQIGKDPLKANPAGAARLVALRKPDGAVAVLLAYLPFAHDDHSTDEIQAALNVLGFRAGKPEPTLIQALHDKLGARRAAAAVALCQDGAGRQLPEVRRLLQDPEPLVRLRLAFALAKLRDREAVPVLIDLLGELPRAQLWQVDEFLSQLAATQAPALATGDDAAARGKYRDAWAAWWRDQGAAIDLASVDLLPRQLGYTLLVTPNTGRVVEIGVDGKTIWELTGLQYPFDARVLPGGRVLVAEYQGKRVTERTLKNEVVWEKQVLWPISCQRLPNGNTFIASRNQLLEVDRAGKEVFTINRTSHDILSAQKLRGGEIACLTNAQRFLRLDTKGKELKAFPVGPVHNYVQFDLLPGGGVLIPQQGNNKVVEFDAEGKLVWEAPAQFPYAVSRLPSGRTLVSSLNANQIVEIDRTGKVVWQRPTDSPAWRVRRR